MEGTHDISDDHVEVCGMMQHILNHYRSEGIIKLKDTYRNFSSIYEAAATQLENLGKKFHFLTDQCDTMRSMIEAIIGFCKVSLYWVVEDDGAVNNSLCNLLAEYERLLLAFIRESNTTLSEGECDRHLHRYKSILKPDNVVDAYVRDYPQGYYSPSSSYQVIMDDDESMLKFIEESSQLYLSTELIEKLNFLKEYLEFAKRDWNNALEVNNLLISVCVVAARIAWYSFFGKWCTNSSHREFTGQVSSDVTVGVLRALILQEEGSSSSIIPPMTYKLLVDYVDCIQNSLFQLDTRYCSISLYNHEGIQNLTRFLIGYQPPDQKKVSDIRVHFQALLRDVGSAIYSCLNIQKNYSSSSKERSLGLDGLMEKMNLIQEEIIEIVSACIISDRTTQDFPKVYPLGFLIFVLDFLKKLVESKSDFIPDRFETIRRNLLLSISFLQNIDSNSSIYIEDGSTADHASKSTEDLDDKEKDEQIKTLIEKSIFFINYLKSGQINGKELNEMLISAQVSTFKIARYFMLRRYGNNFHWWNMYTDTKCCLVDPHDRVGILRALVISSLDGSRAPPLTGELLMAYGECIQDNLSDLVKDEAAIDPLKKYQFKILHDGLSFLMHLIFSYPPKQTAHKERLSEIKIHFHALVMSLGSVIYEYYDERTNGGMSIEMNIQYSDLIKKLNPIQEETIHIISTCMISDRTAEEYPKPLGFLIFVLEFLKNLVGSKSNLITDQLETIRENLRLSISFLKNIENHSAKDIKSRNTTEYTSTAIEGLDDEEIKTMIEKSMFLIKYLKLDQINDEELNQLLISAQVVAFKIARYFLLRMYGNNFHWWKVYSDTKDHVVDLHVRIGSLRALVLLDGSSVPPLIEDELLMAYGECLQDNLIEIVKDKAIVDPMKNQFEILHSGLPFLMNIILTYLPKQTVYKERIFDIKVRMHALVMNLGSIIYLFYSDLQTKGNMEMELSIQLSDLIVNLNLIQEETVGIIISACMISDKTGQEYPLSFLIFVLEFLKKLVDSKSDLLMDQFRTICKNILLSISFLKNIDINTTEDIEGHTSTNIMDLDDKEKSKQMKSLIEKSMLLISYLKLNRVNGNELNELLISAQVVAFKIAHYFFLRRYGNNFHWWKLCSETKDRVLDPHDRVGILRALVLSQDESGVSPLNDELLTGYVECIQDNLIELVKDNAVVDPVKHQFEFFHEGLSFLTNLLFSYPPKQSAHKERLFEIKVRIHALVMNLGSVIYLYHNDLQMKGIATELSGQLTDLSEKLSLIKDETMGIFPLVILSGIGLECPETDQLGFFNFLLENWMKLIESRSDLIVTWKNQFETIHENLFHFRSFIQKHNDASTADGELRNLCNRIRDAGYVAEYLLSSFAEGSFPVWCIPLWISEFTEHIKLIIADINEKNANAKEIRDIDSTDHPSQVSSKVLITSMTTDTSMNPSHDKYLPALPVPTSTHVVVGFEVEMKLIRERLSNPRKDLDVISIIGMAGLGKTTLARKVYEDPFTNFDVRAWCYVSQEYNRKELFLIILGSVSEVTDLIRRKSETDLSLMVHKELHRRRYFIVLDDVWEMDAYMELKRFFPNDCMKSRIMLTSRNKAIGLGARLHSEPIELDHLTDKVSWNLLERKVFGEQKCPLELCHVGNEIARKCKGLPLSVVVVAGILSNSKSVQQLGFWEKVAGNFSSYLAQDPESQCMAALELSYKFLPDLLKPLFLYLGAFPEDKEIRADKLIWLWIAEGLVHKSGSKSLESEAESNLMDLIDRSLVMISERRSDGRVKACNVHDLLRDMCLKKAKEDNFLQQINLSAQNEILDCVAYQRRLGLFLKSDDTTFSKPLIRMLSINPPLRTLLSFNMKTNLNSVFARLKSLRVLHSEGTIISSEASDDVTKLVCLRYVSIQTSWKIIPPSISSIWTLETLIIKGARGEIVVPTQIWKMVKLRHLHINPRAAFNIAPKESSKLENLVTLSTPVIDPGEEEKLIRKVPNVKKLSCIYTEGTYHSFGNSIKYPNLESLCKLESLKMSYYGAVKRTWKYKLPSTLKKLSLSKFRIKWSEISMFQELKNLEVLKLRDGAVLDDFWDVGDEDEFTSLKLLKLESLNIKKWSACAENFPSLEKVVLERCRRLEEIPSDLGGLVTLQKLEVLWCHPSAAKMAKEIQNGQEEFNNELLKVNIYPPPQMD